MSDISLPSAMEREFYETKLDEWIQDCVNAESADTFPELLLRLPSIYPQAVLTALDRLASNGAISRDAATRLIESASDESKTRPIASLQHQNRLPLPHPLDYEWRFTDSTANILLDRAVQATTTGETILLLGVPTVLRASRERMIRGRQFVFIDTNISHLQHDLLNEEALHYCDLMKGPIPSVHADVVLLDSPWYPDYIIRFLKAAAILSRSGASVFTVLPPISTRPSIPRERQNIVSAVAEFGLRLREVDPLAVSYNTPFFEFNALKAAGITHFPHTWRRGDLAHFSCDAACPVPFDAEPSSSSDHIAICWKEKTLNTVRFRVRTGLSPAGGGSFGLQEIIDGDILPTVSAREVARRQANVWTSGNRIFRSENPSELWHLLSRVEWDYASERAILTGHESGPEVNETLKQLENIVKSEIAEYATYQRHA